jgi:hypothetical protein
MPTHARMRLSCSDKCVGSYWNLQRRASLNYLDGNRTIKFRPLTTKYQVTSCILMDLLASGQLVCQGVWIKHLARRLSMLLN